MSSGFAELFSTIIIRETQFCKPQVQASDFSYTLQGWQKAATYDIRDTTINPEDLDKVEQYKKVRRR